jgi:hypothetical protein
VLGLAIAKGVALRLLGTANCGDAFEGVAGMMQRKFSTLTIGKLVITASSI